MVGFKSTMVIFYFLLVSSVLSLFLFSLLFWVNGLFYFCFVFCSSLSCVLTFRSLCVYVFNCVCPKLCWFLLLAVAFFLLIWAWFLLSQCPDSENAPREESSSWFQFFFEGLFLFCNFSLSWFLCFYSSPIIIILI